MCERRSIQEITDAVKKLLSDDLRSFRAWFAEFDAGTLDARLERDVQLGRLDGLADEAVEELNRGRCTEL